MAFPRMDTLPCQLCRGRIRVRFWCLTAAPCSVCQASRIFLRCSSGIVFVADYLKVCGIVVRICKSDTADRFLLADRTVRKCTSFYISFVYGNGIFDFISFIKRYLISLIVNRLCPFLVKFAYRKLDQIRCGCILLFTSDQIGRMGRYASGKCKFYFLRCITLAV